MLLSRAIADFLEWGRAGYSHRTLISYKTNLSLFLKWVGDSEITAFDPLEISRYANDLRDRGLSDSTVAFRLTTIRQLFRFLFFRRRITWDYQIIKIPRYVSNSYPPIPTKVADEMMEQIGPVNCFRQLRDKTILSLLFASGMRVSELCRLQVGEIHSPDQYAKIITAKGYKKRLIFWDDRTQALFNEYLPARIQYATSEYVFISLSKTNLGGRLSTRSVERFVASYRTRLPVTPHWYRHGFGARGVRARLHIRHLQLLLGHKSPVSSQIYWDVDETDLGPIYREMCDKADVDN